jgi:hypothetical protein
MSSRWGRVALAAAALVAAGWVLPTATAGAAFECKTPPTASMPGRAASFTDQFLPPPKPLPPAGDPWAATPTTTIFEQYGMPFIWHTYDTGCTPDGTFVVTHLANLGLAGATFLVALTGGVTAAALDPGWLSAFNNVVRDVTAALWTVVTEPLALATLGLLGLTLLWRAHRAAWGTALTLTLTSLAILTAGAAVSVWPIRSSQIADDTLRSASTTITAGILGSAGNPATAAVASSVDAVLWPRWVTGELGCFDCPVADRYAADLWRASAFTWSEAAEAQASDARAQELRDAKGALWTRTAEAVQAQDPDAYEYLIGHRGESRVWQGFVAMLAALTSQPFLLVAAFIVMASYLLIRLLVMFSPVIVAVGVVPAATVVVKAAVMAAAAAVINAVLFGVGAAVTMLGIEVLLAPDVGIPGWLGIALLGVWTVLMWVTLRPFRRLTRMVVDPVPNVDQDRMWMRRQFRAQNRRFRRDSHAGGRIVDVGRAKEPARPVERPTAKARAEGWSRGGWHAKGGHAQHALVDRAPGSSSWRKTATTRRPRPARRRRKDAA